MPNSRTLLDGPARTRLGGAETFGGGNVWRTALEHSAAPDAPLLTTDTPLPAPDGSARTVFSIAELNVCADALSAWYLDLGVRPRDRVVVYVDDSFEDQLHLAALAQLGAIPVLLNGRMDPGVAARLIARADPVGLYTDRSRLARLPSPGDLAPSLRWTRCGTGGEPAGATGLPDAARYRHSADDPIGICHTSGTTGLPKLVVWSHGQSAAGPRFRLRTQIEREDSVLLSALPQSHSGAIGFTFYALLAGLPLVAVAGSGPGRLTEAARRHRPTIVLAFNEAFSALATSEIDTEAFDSVASWINIGDSAHHEHIRRLTALGHHVVRKRRRPGSVFGDGLGSSELGWAALHRVVIDDMPSRPGYIGTTTELADVRVFRDDGTEAEAGEVGRLGVRSDSVTPGYWDDSDRYYRSMLGGYWLSGDLVYRDAHGQFFHMDRVVDVIRPAGQGVGYSLLMEEILLAGLPDVADCAVVAGRRDGAEVAVALVRPHAGPGTPDPRDLLARANRALTAAGQPALGLLDLTGAGEAVPTGPTGKTLKRLLRDRYADLSAFAAAGGTHATVDGEVLA
ncbi:class I adenylate-forming enzyme family protein [Actinacidiphila rubida]|uniref:Acyl-CoA synthetase (AMP-forming)/AMP-acid ligase II n=1 Tax=Actinacidiphila rubida TaxID=310780 RepID=A0A1H8LLM1_9ACTN|nr:class I adenylate-forming enzyme family protein [Actinacidiphila rubida]SEO06044.1 Acyl-CoA synthetase (AMP-forming)/AMP-acid ligase II [Actinacidiphila rubida]